MKDPYVNEPKCNVMTSYTSNIPVSTLYLHCTWLQRNLPDKRMYSCHHPGNLVYMLHFLYTEMSYTDSVMERTFTTLNGVNC